MYECYGSTKAGSLLTIFGRLFTHYIQMYGLTCGLDDLMLKADAEVYRSEKLKEANESGYDIYARVGGVLPYGSGGKNKKPRHSHELFAGLYSKTGE